MKPHSSLLILLSFGVLLTALWSATDLWRFAFFLGIAFIVLCLGIAVHMGLRRSNSDLFSPPVLVLSYMALGLGFRGLVILSGGKSRLEHAFNLAGDDFTHLMIKVYILGFLAVLVFLLGDRIARVLFHREPRSVSTLKGGVALSSITGAFFFTIGAGVLIRRFGWSLFTHPAEIAIRGTAGIFWAFPLLFGGLYALGIVASDRWTRRRPAGWGLLVLFPVTGALIFLLTSSKAAVFVSILIPIVLHNYTVSPVRFRSLALTIAGFVVALPALYAYRAFGLRGYGQGSLDPGVFPSGFELLIQRSYMADSFAAVMHFTPQTFPFQYGRPWLEVFTFWIPRAIWPDKPFSQSLRFGDSYFSATGESGSSFFAVSWLGDGYMNFGTLGVIALFLILGFLLRYFYEHCTGAGASAGSILVYAAAAYPIAIGPEQALSVFASLILSYLAVAAFLVLLTGRVKR